jgi:transposase InsO family protein
MAAANPPRTSTPRDQTEQGAHRSSDAESRAPRACTTAFRKTTYSRHTKRIAPSLLDRDFNVGAPNQVLAGDIAYISTSDGWLYLAVLLDLYSHRVVGGAMSDRIDTELALSAWRSSIHAHAGAELDPSCRAILQVRQR